MNHQHKETKELNEDLLDRLAAAETRADRAQSATVAALSQIAMSQALSSTSSVAEPQPQHERSPPVGLFNAPYQCRLTSLQPTNDVTKNDELVNTWQAIAKTRATIVDQLNNDLKATQLRVIEGQVRHILLLMRALC
jgi:hypothetical protein